MSTVLSSDACFWFSDTFQFTECLPNLISSRTFFFDIDTKDNNTSVHSIPSSLRPMVVEKCTFCEGFDGFNVLSLDKQENAEVVDEEANDFGWCNDKMNMLQQYDFITYGQCEELKDICIVCYNNATDDDN